MPEDKNYNQENDPEKSSDDSNREEDLIRAYKEEFKRKTPPKEKEIEDENSEADASEKGKIGKKLKKSAPFLTVLIGFFIGIALLGLIMDQWVIPSIVHNRKIVSIPKVEGRQLEQAANLLQTMNLSYEVSAEQFNDNVPEGYVIRQLPAAGSKVKSGRPVYLTLSKGNEKVLVPRLKGKSLREARVALMRRGLILGKTKYEHSEEIAKDFVLTQNIKSGKEVEYGDTVNVTISLGSEFTIEMPYLIGTRIEEVQSILEAKGLELGAIHYEDSETFMPNTIIEQKPFQFSPVQKGSSVSITVAK